MRPIFRTTPELEACVCVCMIYMVSCEHWLIPAAVPAQVQAQ